MAKLKDHVKLFIVERLACFDTPSEVAEAVLEEFKLKISRTQVEVYDPTKAAGADLSEKWRVIFETRRKAFRENIDDIPIANKAVRIRMLGKMAADTRSPKMRADLLSQVAKEVGDAFSNRRKVELMGENGGAIMTAQPATLTPEQIAGMSVAELQAHYQGQAGPKK